MTDIDRRSFIKRTGLMAGASIAGMSLLQNYEATAASGAPAGAARWHGDKGGYGPLSRKRASNEPTGPEYLALPEGFEYVVFGKVGDVMADGTPTPRSHDGMGAFAMPGRHVRLIRNHENRNAAGISDRGVLVAPANDALKYDPAAYGGTTTMDFDVTTMTLVRDFVSCAGTTVNCAGGLMLGDAGWITSEETVAGPLQGFNKKHGYNFIVPVNANTAQFPQPLTAMGRFAHEAVAVDPKTGIVYQTEDSGNDSGFYRFIPNDVADLTQGGRLEMLGIVGFDSYITLTGQVVGRTLPVKWAAIADADPNLEGGALDVASQGIANGGAQFNRLEGIWWSGDRCFFNSTSGGNAGFGQVWEYRPDHNGDGSLTLIYESTGVDPNIGRTPLDSPDNLTVTPRGGIVLCEDDSNNAAGSANDTHPLAPGITDVNRVIGLGDDGLPFEFAVNTLNDSEFAGACFAPNAKQVMFLNTFGDGTPGSGATFAITGPWSKGAL